jgi:hypothetical protein
MNQLAVPKTLTTDTLLLRASRLSRVYRWSLIRASINEPIVQKPEEAISCYLRTKMDVLVAGNFYSSREQLLLPAKPLAELQAAG